MWRILTGLAHHLQPRPRSHAENLQRGRKGPKVRYPDAKNSGCSSTRVRAGQSDSSRYDSRAAFGGKDDRKESCTFASNQEGLASHRCQVQVNIFTARICASSLCSVLLDKSIQVKMRTEPILKDSPSLLGPSELQELTASLEAFGTEMRGYLSAKSLSVEKLPLLTKDIKALVELILVPKEYTVDEVASFPLIRRWAQWLSLR